MFQKYHLKYYSALCHGTDPSFSHRQKSRHLWTVLPPAWLYRNLKKWLISACHAGLDPASRTVRLSNCNGFPFEFAQGGEPVEPRVKPGMTKDQHLPSFQLQHSLLRGSDIHFLKSRRAIARPSGKLGLKLWNNFTHFIAFAPALDMKN